MCGGVLRPCFQLAHAPHHATEICNIMDLHACHVNLLPPPGKPSSARSASTAYRRILCTTQRALDPRPELDPRAERTHDHLATTLPQRASGLTLLYEHISCPSFSESAEPLSLKASSISLRVPTISIHVSSLSLKRIPSV